MSLMHGCNHEILKIFPLVVFDF